MTVARFYSHVTYKGKQLIIRSEATGNKTRGSHSWYLFSGAKRRVIHGAGKNVIVTVSVGGDDGCTVSTVTVGGDDGCTVSTVTVGGSDGCTVPTVDPWGMVWVILPKP